MWPDFTNVLSGWQWLVLAAVPPGIVALYFLKLKRRPLEVPSTYLWHKSVEDLHVNAIWQRLRRNLLLLLQLLFMLAVILAVLRPSWQSTRLVGSRQVLLIDNSASMQATDVRPSRLEEARRLAADQIQKMRTGDVAMIVSFSDTARVEQNFTEDRPRLLAALAAIEPTARPTALGEALRLAAGLVNPTQVSDRTTDAQVAGTRLLIFSDGKFPPVADFELGNLEPVFVPIGRPDAANVAIVAFSVRRHETRAEQLQAFGRLANYGPKDASVLVKLFLEGRPQEINAEALEIPAGQSRGVAFDLGGMQSGTLRLEIAAEDQLALDNRAWAVIQPPRRGRVLLVTPGNQRLVQALSTRAAAALAEVQVQPPGFLKSRAYSEGSEAAGWDLLVYDRCRPDKMPQGNTFFIAAVPPSGGWSAKPVAAGPQIIDTEVSHRLMQWVDLSDLRLLAEATPLGVPQGGTVLADSDQGPLMALAAREGFEDLVLGFKLVDERPGPDKKPAAYFNTDWPLRVSFASFTLNLLSYMGGGRDALNSGGERPGGAVTLDAPAGQPEIEVRKPSGRSVRLAVGPQGKVVLTAADEIGVYRVRAGGKEAGQFAVNLADPAESDIRPPEQPSIRIGYVDVAGEAGWQAGHREIWRELLVLGLAVLLVEWYTYLRRVY